MARKIQILQGRTFARGVLLLGAIFIALAAAEFLFEYVRLGQPSLEQLTWANTNNAKLVDSLSPIARAYNNILAMLVATVGLAIPLTANMHTPKLIDLFLSDRVNQVVLSLMALGAANVLWVLYMVGPEFAPVWAFRLAVYGAFAGWIVVIPYFFYVVRFLDPSNVVERLERDTLRVIHAFADRGGDAEAAQEDVKERLFQIGTLVLKSIDRADRGVAREGIWTLKEIVDHYGEEKDRMPDAWFKVGREDFVGMSSPALRWLTDKRTWLEMQALRQILLSYQHALTKAHDSISAISNVNRVIARHAAARGDDQVVSLCMRFFNTFLREALTRKNARAAYDVLYQYRELASDLRDSRKHLRRISGFLHKYAAIAESYGDTFVAQVAAYDLCAVIEYACEADNPSAKAALDDLLSLPHRRGEGFSESRIKAKLVAAGLMHELERSDELKRIREDLADVPKDLLNDAVAELLAVEKRVFWEVTDRAVNIEWTPESRRPHIQAAVEAR